MWPINSSKDCQSLISTNAIHEKRWKHEKEFVAVDKLKTFHLDVERGKRKSRFQPEIALKISRDIFPQMNTSSCKISIADYLRKNYFFGTAISRIKWNEEKVKREEITKAPETEIAVNQVQESHISQREVIISPKRTFPPPHHLDLWFVVERGKLARTIITEH